MLHFCIKQSLSETSLSYVVEFIKQWNLKPVNKLLLKSVEKVAILELLLMIYFIFNGILSKIIQDKYKY